MARFDMAVLVPKIDELTVVEGLLGADFSAAVLELDIVGSPVYAASIGDLSVAIVAMEGQGNALARSVTDHLIQQLNVSLVFLLGTALGNRHRCTLCSVVVSAMVHDLTERRVTDKRVSFRVSMIEPAGRLRREVGHFHGRYDNSRVREAVAGYATRLGVTDASKIVDELSVEYEHICSSTDVIQGEYQESIWAHDDRLACYDMESGGFGASADRHNGVQWMVIRGVSDFGDQATKSRKDLRTLSTVAAATFLRDFLIEGLKACHPYSLRPPVARSQRLSDDQIYAGTDGYEWFRQRILDQLDIELPDSHLGRDLTLEGFAAICQRGSVEAGWLRAELFKLREQYFEEFYLDYTYDQDLRGFVRGWAEEFKDILRRHTIRLAATDVLDVGVGNGLELEPLFLGARSIAAADVSRRMVQAAARRLLDVQAVHNCAEDLVDIPTASIDLYASLRTYMSRFFDRQAAIGEAYRVLRPGGAAIISIADGYLDKGPAGKHHIIRGLQVPGRDGWVDSREPRRLADHVYGLMEGLGFERLSTFKLTTDIYIWGFKPPTRTPVVELVNAEP